MERFRSNILFALEHTFAPHYSSDIFNYQWYQHVNFIHDDKQSEDGDEKTVESIFVKG